MEDRKFQFGVMKTFWTWIVVMVTQIYLIPLIVHFKMLKFHVYFTTVFLKPKK